MEAILAIPPPGAPPSARALASVPALEAAYVERGPIDTAALGGVGPDQRPLAGRSWGSVLLPLAFALLATILVTGLALGDARPELATMVAVGASPGVRRRFAMWSAAFIALVGGALGALAGIGPAWAMLQTVDPVPDPARCLWLPERSGMGTLSGLGATFCDTPYPIALDVPWLWLAGAVVAVAAVSSVVFGLFTRARVVLPAR
jgi:putative ABC transport system permease protein